MSTSIDVNQQTSIRKRSSGMAAPFDQQVTFLYTSDLAATARFYEEIIGLPLALDQGSCRIYQVSADSFLGFCEREGAMPSGVIITFVTQDVDGWYERLLARGVAFEKTPTFNPVYNIYHCFLRDPNGYLLEIQRFCDPAWPGKTGS
jgi:catechol 2,3-dioxygenase-like lactoylglutathione lyase family enzyme